MWSTSRWYIGEQNGEKKDIKYTQTNEVVDKDNKLSRQIYTEYKIYEETYVECHPFWNSSFCSLIIIF